MMLPFGKHKGQSISTVDPQYLARICCRELAATPRCWDPDCDCTSFSCWRVACFKEFRRGDDDFRYWVQRIHPDVVTAARRRVCDERRCRQCGGSLVPVGSARSNGAGHNDWSTRTLHKKCWRALIQEGVSGTCVMEGSEDDEA